jgi:hypothetical protein
MLSAFQHFGADFRIDVGTNYFGLMCGLISILNEIKYFPKHGAQSKSRRL